MILELDCGNSLIKWRMLDWGGALLGRSSAESCSGMITDVRMRVGVAPSVCRMVSVRDEVETGQVRDAVAQAWSINVHLARPSQMLGGVTNGYEDYQRLGLDRWLALVGAYGLSATACLVLDLGTAVTADYVTGQGEHLGGFICPGVSMMCGDLRMHTRRIRFHGDQTSGDFRRPGRNTGDAVRRGSVLMLRAFVESQLETAAAWLGEEFEVLVTGGDAALIEDVVPASRFYPDLVFLGLAQACPIVGVQ